VRHIEPLLFYTQDLKHGTHNAALERLPPQRTKEARSRRVRSKRFFGGGVVY